ncbi:hypothetical protein KSS87_021183, partial [Heliosperma pusillum]
MPRGSLENDLFRCMLTFYPLKSASTELRSLERGVMTLLRILYFSAPSFDVRARSLKIVLRVLENSGGKSAGRNGGQQPGTWTWIPLSPWQAPQQQRWPTPPCPYPTSGWTPPPASRSPGILGPRPTQAFIAQLAHLQERLYPLILLRLCNRYRFNNRMTTIIWTQ